MPFLATMRFALAVVLCLLPTTASGNWGRQVGRANSDDEVSLSQDWLQIRRASDRLTASLRRDLTIARQKALLGIDDAQIAIPTELFRQSLRWWEDNVLAHASELVTNPAASCGEAKEALVIFLSMERQRSFLGLGRSAGDDSEEGLAAEKEGERLWAIAERMRAAAAKRCRNEAFDECLATGRYRQILELASSRQTDLLGIEGNSDDWAIKALEHCAIYDLRFVSTGRFLPRRGVRFDRVAEGVIALKLLLGPGGLLDSTTGIFGWTTDAIQDSENPWLISISCAMQTAPNSRMPAPPVSCVPGADVPVPFAARLSILDLVHPEFVMDQGGLVTNMVGENRLGFSFGVAQMITKARMGGTEFPLEVFGTVYFAYRPQLTTQGFAFETSQRGTYPVLFEWTASATSTSDGPWTVTDTTAFRLIHRPKPPVFEAEADPRVPIRR